MPFAEHQLVSRMMSPRQAVGPATTPAETCNRNRAARRRFALIATGAK
ncbi:hypothetical protein ACVWXO_009558 [Bradyrhizobium sp. LM2.7]